MKIITLSEQTVIDGKLYRKGEVVQVVDEFSENIKRVVVDSKIQKMRETENIMAVKPIKPIEVKPKEKNGTTK